MAAKQKPEPRRVRLTVPAVDVSTQQWLDLQDDASVSMRLLIRESIERDGYVDVMNKPVEQLPRRGRPPQTETRTAESATKDEEQVFSDDTAQEAGESSDQSTEVAAEKDLSSENEQQAIAEVDQSARDGQPEAQAEPAQSKTRDSTNGVPSGLSDFLTS